MMIKQGYKSNNYEIYRVIGYKKMQATTLTPSFSEGHVVESSLFYLPFGMCLN